MPIESEISQWVYLVGATFGLVASTFFLIFCLEKMSHIINRQKSVFIKLFILLLYVLLTLLTLSTLILGARVITSVGLGLPGFLVMMLIGVLAGAFGVIVNKAVKKS